MTKYFTKDGDEYKEVEGDLYTSEAMTGTINKRLEQQRRNEFGDYEDLKEKAAKVDTIADEFNSKLSEKDVAIGDLTSKLKTAELATDKVKIMTEFGIKDELAEFVTGETAEEMRTRAEKLAKVNPGGKIPAGKQGKPGEGNDANSSKSISRNLFGRNSSDA